MSKVFKDKALRITASVLIIALAAVLIWKFVKITPADKPDGKSDGFDSGLPSVSLDIDFSEVYKDENYAKLSEGLKAEGVLPESGYFCKNAAVNISDGDNVLDVLLDYCKANSLDIDYESAEQNAYGTAYVKGIGGLYEGDCTKKSGWTFTVNGEMPEVGMSDFAVRDGDEIVISFVVF